jgi:uncharacterized repeat protein (TIGR03803 family)
LHAECQEVRTAFTQSDGGTSYAGLILSSNTLYGTALDGGSSGSGTVFAVNTNDMDFTVLHTFTGNVTGDIDGGDVEAGLMLSGNTLTNTISATQQFLSVANS